MATNQDHLFEPIRRFAIDPSGRLGSLYDGYHDCILSQINVSHIQQSYQPIDTGAWEATEPNTTDRLDLLQLFDFEKELQLSIVLNLPSKARLIPLEESFRPVDEFTRIFYWCYINGKEQLHGNIAEYCPSFPSIWSSTNATHIVTEVIWGFYVLIIVKLPSEEETRQKLDVILKKIPGHLTTKLQYLVCLRSMTKTF